MKAMRLLALLMAAALAVPVLSGCSNGTTTDGGDESTDNGDIALNEVGTVYTDKDYGFQLEKPTGGGYHCRDAHLHGGIFPCGCSPRRHPRQWKISPPTPRRATIMA